MVKIKDNSHVTAPLKWLHFEMMWWKIIKDKLHFVSSVGNISFPFRRKQDCYYGETFVALNEKVDGHIHRVYKGSKQQVRFC